MLVTRKIAGLVRHGEGQHVGKLGDELALPQDLGGPVGVVDDEPGDAEVRGLGDGQGPHVDALLRQQGGQFKELARSVLQENG